MNMCIMSGTKFMWQPFEAPEFVQATHAVAGCVVVLVLTPVRDRVCECVSV